MLSEPNISYKPFWGICRPLNSWRANSPNPIQIYCAQNSQIDIYEYFQTNHGLVKLKVNDIMYFEYSERKINLYTNNDSIYQFYDTIYKLEERFKQYNFISPHKAFLVNIDYIQNIHLNDLILEKDIIIPISKLKKKQIKDAYLNAISKEMDQ